MRALLVVVALSIGLAALVGRLSPAAGHQAEPSFRMPVVSTGKLDEVQGQLDDARDALYSCRVALEEAGRKASGFEDDLSSCKSDLDSARSRCP
jgi:hypothetical protein